MLYRSLRRKLFINFSIATALVFLSFGSIYLMQRRWMLGGFEFLLGLTQIINIIALKRFDCERMSFRLNVASVYVMSLIIFYTGGLGDTGFLWIQFIPIFTMLILDRREAYYFTLSYTILLILLAFLHFTEVISLAFRTVQIIQSFVVYGLFIFLTFNNEKIKAEAQRKLEMKNRELMTVNQTDGLTGLFNRTYLSELLQDEFYRFERYDTVFSLIMLDIDHFKRINDTYGHQCGDEALSALADILNCETRKSDIVARWGGEEFLILCQGTPLREAGILAEKLRESITHLPFEEGFSLSASFGVASIRKGISLTRLLSDTDKLMYLSKEQGRNRVSLMDGT